jgi:O-antigen ligase
MVSRQLDFTNALMKYCKTAGTFTRRYWLPLGLAVFLTVPFWAPTRDALKTNTYLFVLLPALLLMCDLKAVYRALAGNVLLLLLLCFVMYISLSSAWVVAPEEAGVVKKMLYVFIFCYGVGLQMQLTERRLLTLLCIGIGVCALGAAISLAWMAIAPADVLIDQRLYGYGPLKNSLLSGNLYGCYLIILVGIIVCVPLDRRYALAALVAGLLIFAFVAATKSRSPLLGLAVASTVILIKRSDARVLKLWLLSAAIAVVSAALFWDTLSARGLSLRPELWLKTLQICLQNPWFGRGAEAVISVVGDDGTVWNNTHNLWLTIWYFAGLPALMLWIAFNALLLRALWQLQGTVATLALGLLVYGVMTTFFDGGGLPGRPTEFWYQIWLPIALAYWAGAGRSPLAAPSTAGAADHSLANNV